MLTRCGDSPSFEFQEPYEAPMTLTLSIGPVIALIAGILILVLPRLLNYIVALYLILIGVLGLFGQHGSHYL